MDNPVPISQGVKLYSSNNIVGATFFGGPLAAGYLLSKNFKKLGDRDAARTSLLIAIGVTVLLFGGLFVIPEQIVDRIPNLLIPFALAGIAGYLVRNFQQQQIEQHIKEGGQTASWLNALGVSMVSLLLTLVIPTVLFVIFGEEDKVVFGPDEAIYYEDGATETDAHRLGSLLQEVGFFDGTNTADVWLARTSTGVTVSFTVQDGIWDNPEVVESFRELGSLIKERVFANRPVEVRFIDNNLITKKVITSQVQTPIRGISIHYMERPKDYLTSTCQNLSIESTARQ